MNEERILECFQEAAEKDIGHLLRKDGEYSSVEANRDVAIVPVESLRETQRACELMWKNTRHIHPWLRGILNRIGRVLGWYDCWTEEDEYVLGTPNGSQIEEHLKRRRDLRGGN